MAGNEGGGDRGSLKPGTLRWAQRPVGAKTSPSGRQRGRQLPRQSWKCERLVMARWPRPRARQASQMTKAIRAARALLLARDLLAGRLCPRDPVKHRGRRGRFAILCLRRVHECERGAVGGESATAIHRLDVGYLTVTKQ